MTRGIRNNNPGNIRKDGTQWAGMLPNYLQKDKHFIIFKEMRWGLRAMFRTLRTYHSKRLKRFTIENIIKRWAPEVDGNNVKVYTDYVSTHTGISRDAIISIDNKQALKDIVRWMCMMESRYNPTDGELEEAYWL